MYAVMLLLMLLLRLRLFSHRYFSVPLTHSISACWTRGYQQEKGKTCKSGSRDKRGASR